jgi:hypothetical protein
LDQGSVIIAAEDGRVELDIIELVALGVAVEELVALRENQPASVSIGVVLINRAAGRP